MRYPPLHVGDLVHISNMPSYMGVVLEVWEEGKWRNVYLVYWFDHVESTILPRAILRRVKGEQNELQ